MLSATFDYKLIMLWKRARKSFIEISSFCRVLVINFNGSEDCKRTQIRRFLLGISDVESISGECNQGKNLRSCVYRWIISCVDLHRVVLETMGRRYAKLRNFTLNSSLLSFVIKALSLYIMHSSSAKIFSTAILQQRLAHPMKGMQARFSKDLVILQLSSIRLVTLLQELL